MQTNLDCCESPASPSRRAVLLGGTQRQNGRAHAAGDGCRDVGRGQVLDP